MVGKLQEGGFDKVPSRTKGARNPFKVRFGDGGCCCFMWLFGVIVAATIAVGVHDNDAGEVVVVELKGLVDLVVQCIVLGDTDGLIP